MSQAIRMVHIEDPGLTVAKAVGELTGVRMGPADILVGTYKRPEQTKGGIILAAQTRDEDEYQGKVGLVLAMGPLAFIDDERHKFGGFKPEIGEWVMFNCNDGTAGKIRDAHCRWLQDVHIKSVIPAPDIVW